MIVAEYSSFRPNLRTSASICGCASDILYPILIPLNVVMDTSGRPRLEKP